MPESEDEMIVLLDEEQRAIGAAPKLAAHHTSTPLHLAFTCYAFDAAGRLLLTRRAWTKKTWPGVWTNTCCGHPAPGERLFAAVARRLDAELGTAAERMDVVVGAVRYRAVMDNGAVENEVGPVLRLRLAGPVRPHPQEVDQTAWRPWADLVSAVAEGSCPIAPWCTVTIERLVRLGPDPWEWPTVPPENWPAALRAAEACGEGKN